jgi:beta-mannosidase
VLDSDGKPKVAYHHLRRALAPVSVWTTDEGLGGVVAHVANDRPESLPARLRVDFYRDFEVRVDGGSEELELPPHSVIERDVEGLLGRFVDASYAFRFGPPQHHAVVVSLETPDGELLSQSFRFPAGRPLEQESAESLGLEARVDGDTLVVRSRRLAYGVRVHNAAVSDNAFSVEPGGERVVQLLGEPSDITLTAVNLSGRVEARRA